MSVKLELYRVFKEVAERGSVSAAAKALYISQSAVSQTISQLERQLEVRLFTRSTRGVTLTGEGDTLYRHVSAAIGMVEKGEEQLRQTRGLEVGELVIGASDTITLCFLLPLLDRFHRAHPGIRLKVLNGTSPEVIELLKGGKVDVAFANLPVRDRSLLVSHCLDVHDIFVAGAGYGCDFDRLYTLEELAALPLIMLEKKSNSRNYVEEYFRQRGVSLLPEIELGSYDMVLALTRIGLGVSCVIREFVSRELARGCIREVLLAEPVPKRSVGAFSLKNVSVSPACKSFLELTGCRPQESEG